MLMLLALLPAARALRAPASARAHPTLRRASSVDLSFEAAAAPASTTVYAGLKDAVAQQAPAGVDAALWASLVDSVKPGDDGAAASTAYARDGELHRVVAAVLPDHCSRHNSPLRPHALASLVGANAGTEDAAVVCRLADGAAAAPAAAAAHVAQANYSRYKYLLHMPGSATGSYSRNLQYLWTHGAVVLVWNHSATEWYYRHLEDGTHYVSVDARSLGPRLREIDGDPALQAALRRGARDFFERHLASAVLVGAAKGCENPNFKGSYLGRFPLVLADFGTSDHLSARSRSMNVVPRTRARGTAKLKRR